MNKNVVLHLLKHGWSLKRTNYSIVFIMIMLMIGLKIFLKYYNVSPEMVLVVQAVVVVGSIMLLFLSFLIPSQTKGISKNQGSNYSWSYILSTVRFTRAYLFTLILEVFFDAFLFAAIISSVGNYEPYTWLISFTVTIIVLYFVRYCTLLGGVEAAKGRSKQPKIKMKYLQYCFFVLVGALGVVISTKTLLPIEILSFILFPCFFLMGIYHPFLTYHHFVTDYNKNERKKLSIKMWSSFFIAALLGCTYFYIDQVQHGYLIFTAINNSNVKKVEALILKDKNILKIKGKTSGLTPLFWAAKQNQEEIVNVILKNGGNINEVDKSGNSLLAYTSQNCNYRLSEFLVKKGINYNQMPSDKMNPLFTAARENCLPLLMYFRKLKMDEGQLNNKGESYIQFGTSRNVDFKSSYNFLLRNNLW